MLEEKPDVWRMHESLKLFEEIANNFWFRKSHIILFFNKMDLLQEKIQRIDPKCCFSDYSGGNNVEKASKFIQRKFLKKAPEKEVYAHFTYALDTNKVDLLFKDVRSIFASQYMEDQGF